LSQIPSLIKHASVQFWILVCFLVLLFFTGGTSRFDAQQILFLRPLSVVACALAMLTLQSTHFTQGKWLLFGFGVTVLLCILQLIPLPPGIWQRLPGHGAVAGLDRLIGLGEVWRPLALTPLNGWSALISLVTPLTVILLGVQLNRDDLYLLLPLLIGFGVFSGLWGILQILGDPQGALYSYNPTNNGAAVGMFANRNHSAALLACLFPMLAVYASTSTGAVDQHRIRQLGAIAVGVVLVPLILVTGSRSGMLLSVPALVVATLLYRKPFALMSERRGEAPLKLLAEHLVAAGIIVGLVFLTIYFSRAEALDRLLEPSQNEELRSNFWNVGVALIFKYLPYGFGIGSFVEAYQIDEPFDYLTEYYINHAHSDWLEIALTGGLPALLILFGAIAAFLFRVTSLWRRKNCDQRSTKLAQLGSFLIIIVVLASAGDYPLRTPAMMAVFAIFCLWLDPPSLQDAGKSCKYRMATRLL
jgi:hypothetical protein